MSTPAEGEWLYDTTRKAGVWGDGAEDDGIPSPNFAEVINNTWTGFTAVQNGSPADPNDLTITIDERFNKAAFLNGATFKTFARFYVKIPANNTGAVNLTVEFGSGGSTITKDLKKIDAAAAPAELEADDLIEGGVYSVVFDGTQWLVVGGLGGGGAGSWELIGTAAPSAVAQVDFTSISGYEDLLLVGANIYPSAGSTPMLRLDQGGGFMTGGSNYVYQYSQVVNGAASDQASLGAAAIQFGPSAYPASDTDLSFRWEFPGADKAGEIHTGMFQAAHMSDQSAGGAPWMSTGMGGTRENANTGAIVGIRFYFSTGNIGGGSLALWGRNNA